MQNPPPPPPPRPMAMPGYLASPGLRIVGGLIDVVILLIVGGIINVITRDSRAASGLIGLIIWVGYFAYFWSTRGQSIGMMAFGYRVRDLVTGQYPDVGKAALRGLIWSLEVVPFTFCIVGAIAWLWMLWDPQRQAFHDKVAGTIVTTN